jgi:hypothetical protein
MAECEGLGMDTQMEEEVLVDRDISKDTIMDHGDQDTAAINIDSRMDTRLECAEMSVAVGNVVEKPVANKVYFGL